MLKVLCSAQQNHTALNAEGAISYQYVLGFISRVPSLTIRVLSQLRARRREQGGKSCENERWFIQFHVGRLYKLSGSRKFEGDGLILCLFQRRYDNEKIWRTQNTRLELLWSGKSLLQMVKKVGISEFCVFVCFNTLGIWVSFTYQF